MKKRDWSAAARKVADEGRCRNCGSSQQLEAAHVVARSLGGGQSADAVIPLCHSCHRLQHDHGRLEILPLLNRDEQIEAVRVLGIARAYSYLTIADPVSW